MLDALPPDTEAAKERDTFWREKLEDELAELEVAAMRQQVNCLAYLAGARNHLRELKP